MLIAFDQYVNVETTRIIYINPFYVISVAPHIKEKENAHFSIDDNEEKELTEIDTSGMDEGTTHTWLVLGEAQHVAGLIRNGMVRDPNLFPK